MQVAFIRHCTAVHLPTAVMQETRGRLQLMKLWRACRGGEEVNTHNAATGRPIAACSSRISSGTLDCLAAVSRAVALTRGAGLRSKVRYRCCLAKHNNPAAARACPHTVRRWVPSPQWPRALRLHLGPVYTPGVLVPVGSRACGPWLGLCGVKAW